MRTQRTALSFLTESKASHVGITSMRRVVITLIVMLLTTVSAWAEDVPTYSISTLLSPMNGGTIDVPTQAKQGTKVQFTVTPADGYQIDEVLLSDSQNTLEGNSETGSYSFTMGTSNVLITVVFKKGWVVTFDANGGTGTMKHVIVANGTKYTIPECGFTGPNNQAFIGWSTVANGNVKYQPGDKVKINNDLTLYAIWEDYHLTLNPNYGGGLDKNITVSFLNSKYTLTSDDVPIREGHTFLGWSKTSTGDVEYETGDEITLTGNLTLYAIWDDTPSNYTLKYEIISESERKVELTGYSRNKPRGKFYIPATVTIDNTEYSVTSIGDHAFMDCSSLKSATIPNSVTSIGNFTFYGCSSLQSVTIPSSVTSIGRYAFMYCSSLTSITINGNPFIGIGAFENTPATVTMNLTASKIDGDYWTTFYHDGYNFQADEYTTVYKGTVDNSSLVLTEVADKIVNSGTAVILKSSGNPVMTLTKTNSSDTNGNSLCGYSERKSLAEVKSANNANTIYTLGNTSAGFGFHKYTGEYVPAGKAFLPLNIGNGAKPILNMVFANETTGISALSSDDNALQNDWFSLDGTRLNGKPTQRGIYINGNKKIVIK